MVIIYNQILLHQIISLLTQHPITHSILFRIDSPSSSRIIISLNKNRQNCPSTEPCSSGRRNLPKMVTTTYPGNLLQRIAANYFMHVLLISMNPSNLRWHLQRLFAVLMVIFADWSSQLGPILRTIQNRYGLLQLSRTGVPREWSIFLFLTLLRRDCTLDAMPIFAIWTMTRPIYEPMKRQTFFWRCLIQELFGTSMDFDQTSLWVIFYSHDLVIIAFSAVYPWLSAGRYSQTNHTRYTPPTHQRRLQRPPHIMG